MYGLRNCSLQLLKKLLSNRIINYFKSEKYNYLSFKSRILNILFWSVISAAFIGPGTVTTAIKAGADHKFALLWALAFSTFACLVLQEASARITIVSGMNLGESIRKSLQKKKSKPAVILLIGTSILLGIIAYQAGNLLGAVSGLGLVLNLSPGVFIMIIGLMAAIVLSIPGLSLISRILGGLVAVMGIFFIIAAVLVKPSFSEIISGLVYTRMIPGSNAGLLILGLVGTTVVPYNLFLGSGLADKGTSIKEMRIGLFVAVLLGGIISMAVMITGSLIDNFDSFAALGDALVVHMGPSGKYILGFGLFAAGFTSAVTAPLAASITVKSLWGTDNEKWKTSSARFRIVWMIVLLTGIIFGMTGVKPIPVIILAQALNGLILPIIAICLLLLLNNRAITGVSGLNNRMNNTLMALVAGVTIIIGLTGLLRALSAGLSIDIKDWDLVMLINTLISFLIILIIMVRIRIRFRNRKTLS